MLSNPAEPASPTSGLTAREAELLGVTLRLLRQHGYQRLTVDAVATEAKASKATIYRRWPSKAELVLAAFTEGVRTVPVAPHTGSLRDDLLHIGAQVCGLAHQHTSSTVAVLAELSRSPALSVVLQNAVHQHELLITDVLADAVARGEIGVEISPEIWDVLPCYLMWRSLIPGRQPTSKTVRELVDDVLMPSLTRMATR